MTPNLVSVIIPCYNGARLLEQTLKSVQWQTHDRWECILIDDGSTDQSGEVFAQTAKGDPRFRYYRQERRGLSAARNAGIRRAQGEFIQLLDADDVLLRRRLELCLQPFAQDPTLDVVYSEYACLEWSNRFMRSLPAKIPGDDPLRAYLGEWNRTFGTPVHVFLIRSKLLKEVGFDESIRLPAEDFDCWMRLATKRPRYAFVDEVLVVYRLTANTLITKHADLLEGKLAVLANAQTLDACRPYSREIDSSIKYFRERLAMAHFRERSFSRGWEIVKAEWKTASAPTRIKMIGWMILMRMFSLKTIVRMRDWLFEKTPLRWGGWESRRSWSPPPDVAHLMIPSASERIHAR